MPFLENVNAFWPIREDRYPDREMRELEFASRTTKGWDWTARMFKGQ
jgi:hypothetical protein